MKEFLEYLLEHIVDHPEGASVSQSTDQSGAVVLTISADQSDMGKIIGKGGKIIRSIRDLCKTLAVKNNTKVTVVLSEG